MVHQQGRGTKLASVIRKIQASLRTGVATDLSTDTQSTSSEVSLTSGSPGSSGELDSLVTIGTTEATPYKCSFCEQAYPRQTLMKLHEQTHTDQLPFECEYCSHRFKHKRSKDRHVKLHTGEKKFKCKYCPSAYCRSDHLKIHLRTHDSQKPYQCSVCNRGYRTAAALTSHLQKHKDREAAAERAPQPYRCLKCAATYPTGDALQEHVRAVHNATPRPSKPPSADAASPAAQVAAPLPPPVSQGTPPQPPAVWDEWVCPYCDRPSRFSNVEALSYHIQTLHMPLMMGVENPLLSYGMPMVPRKVPLSPIHLVAPASSAGEMRDSRDRRDGREHRERRGERDAHEPSAGVKPFTCMLCGAPVPDAAALIKHVQVAHSGGGTGSDAGAAKRPSDQPTDLSRKRPRVNGDVPVSPAVSVATSGGADSPLLCSLCSQPFAEFEAYRLHFQTAHLDGAAPPAPIVCDQCGQPFSTTDQLLPHLSGHLLATAVRYACQRCQRSYKSADQLQKHLTDRHAQTLYKCTICHTTFDTRVDVQVHFAVAHSNEVHVHTCSACNEEFPDEQQFRRHLRSAHMKPQPSASYPCLLCGLHFDQLSAYKQHVQRHQRTFQCKMCGDAFYVEFQLDRHVQTVHAEELKLNGEEPFRGTPPKKRASAAAAVPADPLTAAAPPLAFPSLTAPTSIDVELNPAYPPVRHKCNICDDVQPTARALAEHKLVHCKVVFSDTCAVCKGAVRSPASYQQHMKQHSAPNFPVSCVVCQQTLVSDVEVGIHADFHLRHSAPSASPVSAAVKVEVDADAKPPHVAPPPGPGAACVSLPRRPELFQCLMCQQTYSDREEMRQHIGTHLRENASHACNLCQMTFETPLKLQIHLIEHNFEGCGAYSCYICSAVFTAAAGLQKHMVEHGIDVKPFDCSHCHQRFFFRTELDNHGYLHRLERSVRSVADSPSPREPREPGDRGSPAAAMARAVGSPAASHERDTPTDLSQRVSPAAASLKEEAPALPQDRRCVAEESPPAVAGADGDGSISCSETTAPPSVTNQDRGGSGTDQVGGEQATEPDAASQRDEHASAACQSSVEGVAPPHSIASIHSL